MAIRINFNICDNSPECSGIAACETGALFWDTNGTNVLGNKGVLSVDNCKCISCGKCVGEDGCPVGAIIFAETDDQLDSLTKTLNIDVVQVRRLFVDRYGAEPIDETVCICTDDLEETIKQKNGITIVEFFADWSIQCLLTSIPIEVILRKVGTLYASEDLCFFKCNVSEYVDKSHALPALHIYRNGELLTKVEGYYTQQFEKKFLEQIG